MNETIAHRVVKVSFSPSPSPTPSSSSLSLSQFPLSSLSPCLPPCLPLLSLSLPFSLRVQALIHQGLLENEDELAYHSICELSL